MHCLGSVVGGQVSPISVNDGSTKATNSNSSSNGSNSRGSVISVIRALGVLVCEGRIQGPPRGYMEGPHCIPPLQRQPNNHICEKDNYLCDRYLVLVREITERVSIVGIYLCIEVVLCCDCPCGLVKSKSKHRVLSSASPLTPWQQNSEMLLEFWRIGLERSKSSETMNCQGLYQAVRSRLHFSQVAAWWSRTNGAKPSYIATRILPNPGQPDDHLRRFREMPVEHTFPLAGLGDGNSVKVSVWALPRMEEIPTLQCSVHPTPADVVERPVTPVKRFIPINQPTNTGPLANNNVTSPAIPNNSPASQQQQPTFVYYMSSFRSAIPQEQQQQQQQQPQQQPQLALLDDRLQIDCDKPGKHHCCCTDEDEELEEQGPPAVSAGSVVRPNGERKRRRSLPCRPPEPEPPELQPTSLPALPEAVLAPFSLPMIPTTTIDGLECCFRTQLIIEEQQEHLEKRYKRSNSDQTKTSEPESNKNNNSNNNNNNNKTNNNNNNNNVTYVPSVRSNNKLASKEHKVNLVINPMCNDELATRKVNTSAAREVNLLIPKLSLSQEKEDNISESEPQPQSSSVLDWITRVPGRVLGAEQQQQHQQAAAAATTTTTTTANLAKCEVKMRNSCNLELSPKEFDEILTVLRARTPLYRKKSVSRTIKRRYERLNEVQPQKQVNSSSSNNNNCNNNKSRPQQEQQQKPVENAGLCGTVSKSKAADALLGAILRMSRKESSRDEVITEMTKTWTTPKKDDEFKSTATISSDSNVSFSSISSDSCLSNGESSLPSALNKRFSRIKQLFKRPEQEKVLTPEEHIRSPRLDIIPADSRVKRKIDFSDDFEDNDYAAGDDEQEDDEEKDDDDDDDDELDGTSHCDSLVGTSINSAYLSIFRSTNGEKRINGKARLTPDKEFPLLTRKSRVKRDHSPIWLKHNHYNKNISNVVDSENPIKPDASAEESESGTEVEQDGAEANDKNAVPSAKDQARFRRSLENAASMVFHSRTGLPLTSSPAPLRRGSCCFDFDSSLNSVSSKRSALFELNTPPSPGAVSLEEGDRETESAGDIEELTKRRSSSRHRPQSHALLGSFEESALNGRLEPVSTVHGFAAEIGASGSFCPKHRKLPVTVFFYTLGDNDKVSSPYLAHINLGKKPYHVPRMGTIQVTLLNPLGTVVKMFVVLYDLNDMPPRSHTFLRQRTLRDKTLRYLIHLRFMSGKTGRIYLHTDVRMIICRKADVDTASDLGSESSKELRSYTHGPTNPKFSPRC